MASKTTTRSMQSLTRQVRQRCSCATSASSRSNTIRQFSASASRSEIQEREYDERPRWSYTPPLMKLPFNPRRINDETEPFQCNEDPARLDKFYNKFLGRGGSDILTEEVKWLAITHKSFDQGRRGFNDRLAFLGRRILNLQTSLALVHSAVTQTPLSKAQDGREPFTHPALEGLPNLTNVVVGEVVSKPRLAGLALQIGMADIIRWHPRMKHDLDKSGLDVVLATCMYAVVGAIALQKGGAVAAKVARERVLKPLGI